jgi:glyoxylase-like metal-dependent hydrolase (beta-lactamase superfamily II)
MRFVKLIPLLSIALALLGMLSQSAWAQDGGSEYSKRVTTPRKPAELQRAPLVPTSLGDNIYLLSGDGANIVAISDGNSVLLIDSGTGDRVTELAQAVYQIAQRPVTTVVNTDWHADHAGGNPYFSSFAVTIIAQANTRNRIAAQYKAALKTYVANNQSSFKVAVSPWSAAVENEASARYAVRGIPSVAFNDSMSINVGTEELRFFCYGPAHTDGDTVVFFEKANIVVLGDIFPGNGYPWMDLASGGSLAGLIETLDRVLSMSNEETRIVPAYGPVLHRAELQKYREMLATVQGRIKALLESGATADQVLAATPTSDFDAEWGGRLVSGEMFTSSVVQSIAQGK